MHPRAAPLLLALVVPFLATPVAAHGPDVCALERRAREVQGVAGDGPACRAMRNPLSALGQVAGLSDNDLLMCTVALCMGAAEGPESVAECQPAMAKYRELLRKDPTTIPACPLVWADENGGGGVASTVNYRGDVERRQQGGQLADGSQDSESTSSSRYAPDAEATAQVSDHAARAYRTYGPSSLCLSAEQLIENQGMGDGYIAGVNPGWEWSHRGYNHTLYGGYENQPAWARSSATWMQNYGPWDLIMPWWAAGGVAGSTDAVSLEIGHMSVQYLSRSGQWHVVAVDLPTSGGIYNHGTNATSSVDSVAASMSIAPPEFAHGWFSTIHIDPTDLVGFVVTIQARSTGDAPVLFEAGTDLYPRDHRNIPAGTVMPGAGAGAPRLLGQEWTTVSFTTLSSQSQTGTGISNAQLLANPPPCASPY
ncbi:MAG: hypothetical protein AB7P21_30045 [Lautropia sp.]